MRILFRTLVASVETRGRLKPILSITNRPLAGYCNTLYAGLQVGSLSKIHTLTCPPHLLIPTLLCPIYQPRNFRHASWSLPRHRSGSNLDRSRICVPGRVRRGGSVCHGVRGRLCRRLCRRKTPLTHIRTPTLLCLAPGLLSSFGRNGRGALSKMALRDHDELTRRTGYALATLAGVL